MKNVGPALTVLFLALRASALAQPGSLDVTFGTGGKVITDTGTGYDIWNAVAIQPDGKIIVAGRSTNGTDYDFALVRYNMDGSLDNSFGVDGKVMTDFGSGADNGNAVALQPDGKIVVAGTAGNGTDTDVALARYNTDGTIDSNFGVDGKVTTSFGTSYDFGNSVALQPDGKIVVAGTASNGADGFALARYNTDGTLDSSFGVDGKVTTAFGTVNGHGNSVTIQPDGKILVAGDSFNSDPDLALARYNADGTLDNSFSGDGKVTADFASGSDNGNAVTIQPDGKIIVAGGSTDGADAYFALVRYNTDGTLDNNFGVDGMVTTAFATGYSVAIQADSKIIVAGTAPITDAHTEFALARYNVDGTLDNGFGADGKVTTAFGTGYDVGRAVALQADGKIVVAGYTVNIVDGDVALARYLPSLDIGIIDLSIANNAPLIYPDPVQQHAILEYTLQSDETISVQLLDLQGRAVRTFIKGQDQAAGEHRLSIDLPDAMPSGTYLIAIASPKGTLTVHVMK